MVLTAICLRWKLNTRGPGMRSEFLRLLLCAQEWSSIRKYNTRSAY
jgi:hypothetical protein